jgi:hypothetical protein
MRSIKDILRRSREIDKNLGRYAGALSRFIWPWRELYLLIVIVSLCIFDYLSTYAVLELNGSNNIYEIGRLAAWALEQGGFLFLLAVDIAAVAAISLIALGSRYLY